MPAIDLSARPRLSDLRRIGGAPVLDANLTAHIESAEAELEAARRPRRTPPAAFEGCVGYQEDFLPNFSVPLPLPSATRARDVLPIAGNRDNRLDYTHFSVVMSKQHRIAMFVVVNIDGAKSVKIDRTADKWALDGRIPDDAQIGEELYADNLLADILFAAKTRTGGPTRSGRTRKPFTSPTARHRWPRSIRRPG